MQDQSLIQQFISARSERAFTELVTRYSDLVFSAALRQLRNPTLAEEAAQNVFICLARKATSLRAHQNLAGWLYQTARFESMKLLRDQTRRALREQAAAQHHDSASSEATWESIAPILDDAMARLKPNDREALLWRFFQNKTHREIAAHLAITEDAVQKRIERALEKLRHFLATEHRPISAASLALLLSTHAIQASPTSLAALVSASTSAAASAAASPFAFFANLKIAAGIVLTLAALLIIPFAQSRRDGTKNLPVAPVGAMGPRPAGAPVAESPERKRLREEAEAARRVADEVEKEVTAILDEWEVIPTIFDDIELYTAQLKRLADIGPPAIPALSAGLAKTTRDVPLRLIPFALRAIGDAQAVPALIRAFPQTLRPPGSDCGMSVSDPALVRFMQSHDITAIEGFPRDRNGGFDMARPVRELSAALRKLTGHKLNEEEVFLTFLTGGEAQQNIQRRAFHDVAENWAAWWGTNWNRFVTNAALAVVSLPAVPKVSEDSLSGGILTGQDIRVSDGAAGWILSPLEVGTNCAFNLGLSKIVNLPKTLSEGAASFENIHAWAQSAGVDLLGGQYRDPVSGKLIFCLRGVNLRAWEIQNEQWNQIENSLQNGEVPPLNVPAADYLLHYDAEKGQYSPEKKAAFLFITRQGVQGVLRITAQVTQPMQLGRPYSQPDESSSDQRVASGFAKGAQFDFKFIYRQTEDMKREDLARRSDKANRDASRQERKLARLFAKHPRLVGTVSLPDGTPASGATILLGIPGENAILGDRQFVHTNDSTITQVAMDGTFALPHVPAAHHLYVAHPQGFAEADLVEAQSSASTRVGPLSLSLQLAPWGKLEGTMIRQGKPAPREKVLIMNPNQQGELNLSSDSFKTETDESGKFTFINLPPGEFQVWRLVGNRFYEPQTAKIEAGKTTIFEHGFNGRTLKGRFITSDSSDFPWKSGPRIRFANKNKPFISTARSLMPANFEVKISSNGDFQIADVPPGLYDFTAELMEDGSDDLVRGGAIIGRLAREITVPALEPNKDDTLDFGEVIVQMTRPKTETPAATEDP